MSTDNWDLAIGDRYFQRTIYDARELFAEVFNEDPSTIEPLRFKVYRDVQRYSLGHDLPLSLGDARSAFQGFVPEAVEPSPAGLDPRRLSTLLYYAYGLSRRDEGAGAVWPLHRFVPSARCLFPTELYVWIPETGEIPAGVYHYDNLHHHLELLRLGDYREEMSSILGASLDGAQGVCLFSSLFWKNAYKYRAYSYRLCTQEAGMVVGNTLMVGGALGLRGHVHYQFLDDLGGRLLGLDDAEERLLAAVSLYSSDDADKWQLRPRAEDRSGLRRLEDLPPIAPAYVRLDDSEHDIGDLFNDIARGSCLSSVGEFAREAHDARAHTCARRDGDVLTPPAVDGERCRLDLAETLRTRNSGNVLFNPVAAPVGLDDFWEIVRYALTPYACDLRESDAEISLSLYLAVFDVEGIPDGVYRFCAAHGGLHLVDQRDVSLALQGVMAVPNLNLCDSNMVLYIAGRYPAASRIFGNRAYRILNLEGGLIAQRICVMSAAFGLSARIHNGYDAAKVENVLKIADTDLTPLFQIAIGHNRPGMQYALPIVY